MGGLGMRELVIILLVVLVVFGAKKLRTVGSDLGHAVRGFKKAMSEGDADEQSSRQAAKQLEAPAAKPDADFAEADRSKPKSGQA